MKFEILLNLITEALASQSVVGIEDAKAKSTTMAILGEIEKKLKNEVKSLEKQYKNIEAEKELLNKTLTDTKAEVTTFKTQLDMFKPYEATILAEKNKAFAEKFKDIVSADMINIVSKLADFKDGETDDQIRTKIVEVQKLYPHLPFISAASKVAEPKPFSPTAPAPTAVVPGIPTAVVPGIPIAPTSTAQALVNQALAAVQNNPNAAPINTEVLAALTDLAKHAESKKTT